MKDFRRATIEPLDDGTYTIEIDPIPPKSKSGEISMYDNAVRYSVKTLAEAIAKLEDYTGVEDDEKDDVQPKTPNKKPVTKGSSTLKLLTGK